MKYEQPPCFNCDDRETGCHISCPAYRAYRQDIEAGYMRYDVVDINQQRRRAFYNRVKRQINRRENGRR